METKLNSLQNLSPEDIAQNLFTNEPKEPCSCSIVTEEEASSDLTWWFEILVIILLEGLNIFADLSAINVDDITVEHIENLNPWFKSIGFKLKVDSYDINDLYDKQFYGKYYCKVILRDKLHETFFIIKNIDKNYHFILNGTNLDENRAKKIFNELYLIFQNNKLTFKISFDFYKVVKNKPNILL